jgi:S1-C subfamily serine protease
MAEKLIELSRDELERKIRGTRAESSSGSILDGRGWWKNGDENFVLRGSRVADFVRQRIAGPAAEAPRSAPVATPAVPRASATVATAAPVPAPVERSAVANLGQRRRSVILENSNKHVAKVSSKGTSKGGSIMENANAFAERQRAAREERERANQDGPKGAA